MAGLSFDNYQRNNFLAENSHTQPKATSTGTTIVGVKFNNGVVIAADTRSTQGPISQIRIAQNCIEFPPKYGVLVPVPPPILRQLRS